MSWMGSHGVGPGAGLAPRGLRRKTARWAAGGAAAAATVAAGLMAAPPAMAVATIPVPCSVTALRNAITFAPSNAILVLTSGCVYRLTSALPTITRNLTIEGSNDTITAFSGNYTILTNNGATVALDQLRITDAFHSGAGALAGAIFNTGGGALSLTSVTLADNTGPSGGGVFNNTGASLTVASSNFIDNESTGLGGGAIANGATATTTISGTTFLGNDASGDVVAGVKPAVIDGNGGAIVNLGGAVTVQSPASTFTDNFASSEGGAIASLLGTLNVTKATFNENEADGDGGAVANGGTTAAIAQSGFSGNFSDDDGGAIAASARLTLTSDTFSTNEAEDDGGALFITNGNTTLDTTKVFLNRAVTGTGGGIRRTGGTVSFLNNSQVILNRPNNCSGVFCPA
jgi:predicted outer membrane repeat protein